MQRIIFKILVSLGAAYAAKKLARMVQSPNAPKWAHMAQRFVGRPAR